MKLASCFSSEYGLFHSFPSNHCWRATARDGRSVLCVKFIYWILSRKHSRKWLSNILQICRRWTLQNFILEIFVKFHQILLICPHCIVRIVKSRGPRRRRRTPRRRSSPPSSPAGRATRSVTLSLFYFRCRVLWALGNWSHPHSVIDLHAR